MVSFAPPAAMNIDDKGHPAVTFTPNLSEIHLWSTSQTADPRLRNFAPKVRSSGLATMSSGFQSPGSGLW